MTYLWNEPFYATKKEKKQFKIATDIANPILILIDKLDLAISQHTNTTTAKTSLK